MKGIHTERIGILGIAVGNHDNGRLFGFSQMESTLKGLVANVLNLGTAVGSVGVTTEENGILSNGAPVKISRNRKSWLC